jgi:serine/threonine protein kinase
MLITYPNGILLNDIEKSYGTIEIRAKNRKIVMLPKIAYVITCELFKEILGSVNYLHNHKPPVIHRDLKPANILITDESSGRFVKLGDFGLAVNHEFEDQSHTEGTSTLKYIAPEVFKSRKYGTKADIYSLGVILEDLFNIDSDMYSYFESCFLFSLLNFFP